MRLYSIIITIAGLIFMNYSLNMDIYTNDIFQPLKISPEKLSNRAICINLSAFTCLAGLILFLFTFVTNKGDSKEDDSQPVNKKLNAEYLLFSPRGESRLDEDAILFLAVTYRRQYPAEKTPEIIKIKALDIALITNTLPPALVPSFRRILRERLETLRN